MSMSALLAIGGQALGGAAGAAGSGLLRPKKKTQTPIFAKEQKPFIAASNALIPYYLSMLTGGTPQYLQRLIASQTGALQRGMQQGIQGYLRKIGSLGGDFGAQAQAQLGQMYQSVGPSLAQMIAQVRQQGLGQAMSGLQNWSQMTPRGIESKTKYRSLGMQALGGALQGVGGALGAKAPQQTQTQGNPSTVAPVPQMQPLGQGTTLGGSQAAGAANIGQLLPGILGGGR